MQIWLGFWRYAIYRAGVDDGIFTQVVRSIGGCFCATPEGGANHFSVHFSPVLAIAYPFVAAAQGARGLIVLQALCIALTVFPLYGIARRALREIPAALVAACALLYPVLWAQTFTDFHENAFAPALSAMLAWAIITRRWTAGYAAAALLMCVKEDQFVLLALTGAIAAIAFWREREARRFGITVAAAAIVAGLLFFGVLRPHLTGGAAYFPHFYDWTFAGPSPRGDVPFRSPERFTYLFWAFLPLLFLPFGSRLALLAIPGFVEVLASHERITMVLGTHYSMIWSGYVLAAFCDTLSRIWTRGRLGAVLSTVGTAAACILVLIFNDPMSRWYYLYRKPDANDAQLQRVLDGLPSSRTIGTSDEIFAHIATRPNAFIRVTGEYYVADAAHDDPTWTHRDRAALADAVRAGNYRIVLRKDGIVVARRR